MLNLNLWSESRECDKINRIIVELARLLELLPLRFKFDVCLKSMKKDERTQMTLLNVPMLTANREIEQISYEFNSYPCFVLQRWNVLSQQQQLAMASSTLGVVWMETFNQIFKFNF